MSCAFACTCLPVSRQLKEAGTGNVRSPPPHIPKRASMDEYRPFELISPVRWIESDGCLRTDQELTDEMIKVLGFKRKRADRRSYQKSDRAESLARKIRGLKGLSVSTLWASASPRCFTRPWPTCGMPRSIPPLRAAASAVGDPGSESIDASCRDGKSRRSRRQW